MENKNIKDLLFSDSKNFKEINKASQYIQCIYVEEACFSLLKLLNVNEKFWDKDNYWHISANREEDSNNSYFSLVLNEHYHNDEDNYVDNFNEILDLECNTEECFKKFLTQYLEKENYSNFLARKTNVFVLNKDNYVQTIIEFKDNLINLIEPEYLIEKQKYLLSNNIDITEKKKKQKSKL